MIVKIITTLIVSGTVAVALCDNRMDSFRTLYNECSKLAEYCETNHLDIVNRGDAKINATSSIVHNVANISAISDVYDSSQVTNVEFEICLHGDEKRLLGFVARYDNGNRVCAEYSKRRISKIHRQIGQKKFQVFEIRGDKLKSEGIYCYDIEEIGNGEDFVFTNRSYYENGNLVREEPPSRLSKMMSERNKEGATRR